MNETDNYRVLLEHLEKVAETDAELFEALQDEDKKIDRCYDYVYLELTKGKKGGILADGDEVMRLAIQYYKDKTLVMPKLSNPKKEEPKKEDTSSNVVAMQPKKQKKTDKPKASKNDIKTFDLFADM